MALQFKSGLMVFALVTLSWTSSCFAQAPDGSSGIITGTVVDQSGAVVAGARVKLTATVAGTGGDQPPSPEIITGNDGQFSFANIAPGPFHLTITSAGFAMQTSS